jgi:post-segregation antitoxin (ccd killing protein)
MIMGRAKKKEEEKKTKVSVSLEPELLNYYRSLHINLSSLVNKLLKEYRENGHKNL